MILACKVALVGTLIAYRLARPANAQNSSLPEHCPSSIHPASDGGLFNSTGTGKIQFSQQPGQSLPEPWYLTQTLRDVPLNENNTRGTQALTVLLSVPESFVGSETANNTKVCAYRMMGLNATSNEDGSCHGLLSDACLAAIDDLPAIVDNDETCPVVNVRDSCGQGFFLSTSRPFNFSSAACSVPSLISADLPNDYGSFVGIGTVILTLNPEPDDESYDMYNLRVRQPAPVLIKARLGDSGANAYQQQAMLCVAPNKVVEGSREPKNEFPPSSASGLQSQKASMLALAVSFIVAREML